MPDTGDEMTSTSVHMGTAGVDSARRRDGLTVLFGVWLMVGLFIDGYMHNTRGDQLESFLTPWHGVLYSGFLVSAVWISWPAFTATGPLRDRVAALPRGYGLGMLGAAVFAVGGILDSAWHTAFGIEVDIEALISPPHLILFCGAMLVLTTPARSAWHRSSTAPSLRQFLPALASVTLAALLVGFFLMYASGLYDFHAMAGFREFMADEVAAVPFLPEVFTAFGILARLLTTVVLMVPALLLLRRWATPPGSFTILFSTYGLFMFVLNEFGNPELLVAAVAAGVVADVLSRRLAGDGGSRAAHYAFGAAVPATLWLVHFGALAVTDNLAWSFLVWGGVVLFAAGAGVGLVLLAFPPRAPSPAAG